MNILIVNWAGLNTGDDAMLECIVSAIRKMQPDASIGVVGHSISDNIASSLNVSIFGTIFEVESGVKRWQELFSAIRWADYVIVGGGDIIRERIASFLPFSLAALLGKPVIGVSLGVVQRSTSAFWNLIFDSLPVIANHLYIRDQRGAEVIGAITQIDNLVVAPDVAFSGLVLPNNANLEGIKTVRESFNVVINLRELNDQAYSAVMQISTDQLLTQIEALIHESANGCAISVVLLPMVDDEAAKVTGDENDNDSIILRKLQFKLSNRISDIQLINNRPSGLLELHNYFDSADLIIGSRYHFLIGALQSQAEIYAIPYAEKVKQLIKAVPAIKDLTDQLSWSGKPSIESRLSVVSEMSERAGKTLENSLRLVFSANTSSKQQLFGIWVSTLLMIEPLTLNLRSKLGKLKRKFATNEN